MLVSPWVLVRIARTTGAGQCRDIPTAPPLGKMMREAGLLPGNYP